MNRDLLKDYLAHCYLYYTLNESVISDHSFDNLCKEIRSYWANIQSPYVDYVFALENGHIELLKGSELGETCPYEIQTYALQLLEQHNEELELFSGSI